MTNKLDQLSQKTGTTFQKREFIEQAFVHRSYLNENKKITISNERLEFLGDSILSFLVTEYLYTHYPDITEGGLTNLRSAIVKTKTLAQAARDLNLGEYLLLSKGEEEGGGRDNPSLLADTFEAFLGALFLDQGLPSVKKMLECLLFTLLPQILKDKTYKDAKSLFQEIIQEETKISPVYKVVKEVGPDHAKEFTVSVYVVRELWGTGRGKSKQEAEIKAAESALEKWGRK